MKTGNTRWPARGPPQQRPASMEPGHEDREYAKQRPPERRHPDASMEPGHEDREYSSPPFGTHTSCRPQWSPVMKTGNTAAGLRRRTGPCRASMEPGHEDREYSIRQKGIDRFPHASMEPGHEDREYGSLASVPLATSVAHSCEDCHSAPPADGRERRQGRQEPALTRARALSGDPIGTRALARQSGILSWGAACGVRRT